MQTKVYSEEDIAKVVAFYNIHKYSKTYKQMASEYGIPLPSFYYLVKKDTQKALVKGREVTLAYIAETKRKYGWCSIKATASILKVPYKQIEKWLFDAGYEASIAGGFIFSTSYINKIVRMYNEGNSIFEIITVTKPVSLHDVEAMQKLIDNNIPAVKEEASRKKVYTQEEIQGCIDLVDSGTSVKETARTTHIPESTIRGWIKKENKEPQIIEVPKEYHEGFVNEDNVNLTEALEQASEPIAFKSREQFKRFNASAKKIGIGVDFSDQFYLRVRLGEIEHKIAEHNIEIKKLEGYRETLKQAILILNTGL